MTNEQREAIEYLKESVLIYKNTIPKISDAIDTVLSLIKEQNKKIEDREKSLHDEILENYDKQELLNKQLKQKDRQIDLMADVMYKTGTGRRALSCVFRQNDECNENGCRYCIKQYFADKAKMSQ